MPENGPYVDPLIGREKYDGFDRHGTSKYVYALRIGRGRWRLEVMRGRFVLLLGPVTFSAGFEWSDAR